MLEKTLSKAREQFGFPEAVLASFRFLVEDFGFSVVEHEPTYVRFESREVFVNLYHGRGSYELGVEIGERLKGDNTPERSFTLREIIGMTDAKRAASFHLYQAMTRA